MPISALTAPQLAILDTAINRYIRTQLDAGNLAVYHQIRVATTAQIQAALNPILNVLLTNAQTAQANLAAAQAQQTADVNQTVTDTQAVIAQLA